MRPRDDSGRIELKRSEGPQTLGPLRQRSRFINTSYRGISPAVRGLVANTRVPRVSMPRHPASDPQRHMSSAPDLSVCGSSVNLVKDLKGEANPALVPWIGNNDDMSGGAALALRISRYDARQLLVTRDELLEATAATKPPVDKRVPVSASRKRARGTGAACSSVGRSDGGAHAATGARAAPAGSVDDALRRTPTGEGGRADERTSLDNRLDWERYRDAGLRRLRVPDDASSVDAPERTSEASESVLDVAKEQDCRMPSDGHLQGDPARTQRTRVVLGFEVPEGVAVPSTLADYTLLERTARATAAGSQQFELLLRTKQAGNPRFAFLEPGGQFHPLYLHVKQRATEGATNWPTAAEVEVEPDSAVASEVETNLDGADASEPTEAAVADDVKDTIEKFLRYVQELGRHYEARAAERFAGTPMFAFLRPEHPTHAHYLRRRDDTCPWLAAEGPAQAPENGDCPASPLQTAAVEDLHSQSPRSGGAGSAGDGASGGSGSGSSSSVATSVTGSVDETLFGWPEEIELKPPQRRRIGS